MGSTGLHASCMRRSRDSAPHAAWRPDLCRMTAVEGTTSQPPAARPEAAVAWARFRSWPRCRRSAPSRRVVPAAWLPLSLPAPSTIASLPTASTIIGSPGWLGRPWKSWPYDMTRVPPLGVPAVVCLAFWGGIWGVVLSPLLRHAKGAAYWTRALLFGAVVPSAVGLFLVLPLKGMPVAVGGNPAVIIEAPLLNGAWGLGVALLRSGGAASRDRTSR